ncbi:MAG: elongation factor P [Sandaracinaceae bacterium]
MDTSDIRKNLKIILDGNPWAVIDHQFVKPGKGQAFIRTKLRNMITGSVLERTFKSGEKLEKADISEHQMQYLYPEGEAFVFMNTETYEQIYLRRDVLEDTPDYLQDGMMVDVLFWGEKPIGCTPPIFVELEVTETEPGFKGDTSSNVMKPATLSTGKVVPVPLFVNQGDMLKIDTRTGSYVERVKK